MTPREKQARDLRSENPTPSYAQIAAKMGISIQRAYQLVNRESKPYMKQPNKAALRKILEKERDNR